MQFTLLKINKTFLKSYGKTLQDEIKIKTYEKHGIMFLYIIIIN